MQIICIKNLIEIYKKTTSLEFMNIFIRKILIAN